NIVPLARITPPDNTPSSARNVTTGLDHSGADLVSFERFYWQHERHIIGYLCRMIGDEQAAHDLSQETFLRAWRHFATLRQHDEPRAWLFRVATNLALTFLRRRAARPVLPLDEDLAGQSDPGRQVAIRDLVTQALAALTPRQRAALILHEIEGLSCEEIGALLGISRDAVKMALWRAREQFRKHYLQEDD
ncbi:MAG TPA: RNA polymerase sigma factor, partial [Ktedonobacterales bacterium]|nr:RNA polymerase sigma factor [Ktedonobacterales bacterium]